MAWSRVNEGGGEGPSAVPGGLGSGEGGEAGVTRERESLGSIGAHTQSPPAPEEQL